MAITPVQRLVSSADVIARPTRAMAIAALLAGNPGNSVVIGNIPSIWPQIAKYDGDNNDIPTVVTVPASPPFNTVADPAIIWYTNPIVNLASGETYAFAAQTNVFPGLAVLSSAVVAIAVFADNAHTLQIDLYNAVTNTVVATTKLSTVIADGNMSGATGLTEITPVYNWQKVRFYTIPFNIPLGATVTYKIVYSFEVTNYQSPLGGGTTQTTNPAGLAFIADLYLDILP